MAKSSPISLVPFLWGKRKLISHTTKGSFHSCDARASINWHTLPVREEESARSTKNSPILSGGPTSFRVHCFRVVLTSLALFSPKKNDRLTDWSLVLVVQFSIFNRGKGGLVLLRGCVCCNLQDCVALHPCGIVYARQCSHWRSWIGTMQLEHAASDNSNLHLRRTRSTWRFFSTRVLVL